MRLRLVCAGVAVAAGLTFGPVAQAAPPAVWIGSPVVGTWGSGSLASTTPAGGHHRLSKASPGNQWAVDLSKIPANDRNVYLYAAPNDTRLNNSITAKISQIVDNSACKAGGGGDFVTVSLYYGATRIGRVTYAHIDRVSSLAVGKTIPRWGTLLGAASNLTSATSGGSNCWTGRHVHLEMRSEQSASCWNKGWRVGQAVSRTNFVGFIGGSYGSTPRACP